MDTDTSSSAVALRCWIKERRIWLELADQRLVSVPVAKFPLLANATPEELNEVKLRVGGRALRWEGLDEDIWVDDAVRGRFPKAAVVTPAV